MSSGTHAAASQPAANSVDGSVATASSGNLAPLILKRSTKEEWGYGERKTLRGFAHPIPGTWIKPVEGMVKTVLALVCCPKCKQARLLDDRIHSVSPESRVVVSDPRNFSGGDTGDFQCPCGLLRRVHLDRWLKKPLYACAIEHLLPHGKIRPEILYVNADSESEAKFQCGPGHYRFVAVAPAIAFFTADKDGKDESKLVADIRSGSENFSRTSLRHPNRGC